MYQLIIKALISGLIIALASEAANRSKWLGALIVSLPVTSILTLCWLYRDGKPAPEIGQFAMQIFWAVGPSLVFFVVVWWLTRGGMKFPLALALACAATALAYAGYVAFYTRAAK